MKGANRVHLREPRLAQAKESEGDLVPGAPGWKESRRETDGAARSAQIACESNRSKGV